MTNERYKEETRMMIGAEVLVAGFLLIEQGRRHDQASRSGSKGRVTS